MPAKEGAACRRRKFAGKHQDPLEEEFPFHRDNFAGRFLPQALNNILLIAMSRILVGVKRVIDYAVKVCSNLCTLWRAMKCKG